jgi:O-6-methylguanine DNA methyltransferase
MLIIPTPMRCKLAVNSSDTSILSSTWLPSGSRQRGSTIATPLAAVVQAQVQQYFAGKLEWFDLPLEFQGTAFEVAIWNIVYRIPFGAVLSYGDVARIAGRPGAHRGVARSMATLEFALFVPAHRVIGADGRVKGASEDSLRYQLYEFERNSL